MWQLFLGTTRSCKLFGVMLHVHFTDVGGRCSYNPLLQCRFDVGRVQVVRLPISGPILIDVRCVCMLSGLMTIFFADSNNSYQEGSRSKRHVAWRAASQHWFRSGVPPLGVDGFDFVSCDHEAHHCELVMPTDGCRMDMGTILADPI